MNAHATSAVQPWKFLFPLALIAAIVAVVTFASQEVLDEALFVGVAIDLIVTVPFVYWLVIRKTSIPKTTIAPIVVGGVVLASYLTPDEHAGFIGTASTILIPMVELTVVGLIGYKIHQAVKAFKRHGNQHADPMLLIRSASKEIAPGKAGELVASEIAMLYYALFVGGVKPTQPNEFPLSNRSGSRAILWALVGMIIVEGFAVHMLVQMWLPTLAWILTALSAYTLLQIIALIRSVPRRHVRIEQELLVMPYGITAECVVDRSAVASIEVTTRDLSEGDGEVALSPLKDLDKHNVIVHFREPQTIEMMYGFRKQCTALALNVDDATNMSYYLNK